MAGTQSMLEIDLISASTASLWWTTNHFRVDHSQIHHTGLFLLHNTPPKGLKGGSEECVSGAHLRSAAWTQDNAAQSNGDPDS